MRLVLCLIVCALAVSAAEAETPSTITKSIRARIGATVAIGTFGQHSYTTCEPIGGGSVQTTKPPSLGEIRTTEDQPYIERHSISGTCIGAHLLGTRVDYTARSAGNDSFEFDMVFNNGTIHYVVNSTNR